MFKVAGREGAVNFVHVRFAGQIEPGSAVEAVQEMIANSAAADASVHIVHIGSSGLRQVPLLLEMIETAQSRDLDVTTEVYPYTAASAGIQAAIFDPGWRERLGADYGDIEWVATGERLTEASFNEYREQGGTIIAHIIPEDMVEAALAHPLVMVASDGVGFVNGRAHPRGAGSFSRVLGRYVRERNVLSLMDALGKMTIMPARRMEAAVPQMRTRGPHPGWRGRRHHDLRFQHGPGSGHVRRTRPSVPWRHPRHRRRHIHCQRYRVRGKRFSGARHPEVHSPLIFPTKRDPRVSPALPSPCSSMRLA